LGFLEEVIRKRVFRPWDVLLTSRIGDGSGFGDGPEAPGVGSYPFLNGYSTTPALRRVTIPLLADVGVDFKQVRVLPDPMGSVSTP